MDFRFGYALSVNLMMWTNALPDLSAIKKAMMVATESVADFDGYRVQFTCYNRMPLANWYTEWGVFFFDDGSGPESAKRNYPDSAPGDSYLYISPSANKCMIVVGGLVGMLHKLSGTMGNACLWS